MLCHEKLRDSFKEFLLGDLTEMINDRIFLVVQVHTLFRKVDESMKCTRPCREAHDELSKRLGIVTNALQIVESTEKDDEVAELNKWSDIWLEQMKFSKVSQESPMFNECNMAALLKVLRSSSPEPFIYRFLVSQLSFEASTRSCKIHERLRDLKHSLPEGRCQTLVQKALVADRAFAFIEKIEVGSTKSRLCELASVRSDVQILKDEQASWVVSVVKAIENAWQTAFKEFNDSSKFAEFPETLKKYEDAQAAIIDGSWNDKFPWVSTQEHPDEDAELASLQFAVSHARNAVKLALAILPSVSGDDKRQVQDIETAASVEVKKGKAARVTMASVCLACEVLKNPPTSVGENLIARVKEVLSELSVKMKSLPPYIQTMVNSAMQEKTEPKKSDDVLIVDAQSVASSSQASPTVSTAPTSELDQERAGAPQVKKRRFCAKLSE